MIEFIGSLGCQKKEMDFFTRIQDGTKSNKTEDALYYTWGGSVIKQGSKYYLFANRWIKDAPNTGGFDGWVYFNRIYRYESDNLLGPYTNPVELTELRVQSWSAGAVMNPYPLYHSGKWWLYYTGTTSESQVYPILGEPARENQQIGVAYTNDVSGSWTVSTNNPIISPRPAEWDKIMTNNPVPFLGNDGIIRCIYKSDITGDGDLRLGLVKLSTPEGPITSRSETASELSSYELEDASVWLENCKTFYMIAKTFEDIPGVNTDEGALFESIDGDTWVLSDNPLAYDLAINWDDLSTDNVDKVERAFVYTENNRAIALFTAVLDGSDSYNIGRLLNSL